MNTATSCLYSEVIKPSWDHQRSAIPGRSRPPPPPYYLYPSFPCKNRRAQDSKAAHCAVRRPILGFPAAEHGARTALPGSAMATAILKSAMKTAKRANPDADPTRSAKASSSSAAAAMSMPCHSNAVRACVAGTKYGVGKLEKKLCTGYGASNGHAAAVEVHPQ